MLRMLRMMMRMRLSVMLGGMFMVLVSMKGMPVSHFMMMSRFVMISLFMSFMSLFMMMGCCLMMFGCVMMVIVF
jgi:hypothetical protein